MVHSQLYGHTKVRFIRNALDLSACFVGCMKRHGNYKGGMNCIVPPGKHGSCLYSDTATKAKCTESGLAQQEVISRRPRCHNTWQTSSPRHGAPIRRLGLPVPVVATFIGRVGYTRVLRMAHRERNKHWFIPVWYLFRYTLIDCFGGFYYSTAKQLLEKLWSWDIWHRNRRILSGRTFYWPAQSSKPFISLSLFRCVCHRPHIE